MKHPNYAHACLWQNHPKECIDVIGENMPEENKTFEGIALALSGGGYRAAAFHLGTLQMLEKLGLRTRIRALSTVSGGTIFGAAYVKSLIDKQPFEDFATDFRLFMRNTNVIKAALDNLPNTRHVNGLKVMPSLIRSAASIYARDIFGQSTFGDVLDSKIEIDEISFNTTEFKGGRSFRFQSGGSSRIYSGNQDLRIGLKSKTNRAARLADIVAASSCFPSGFEPIRFPSDFVWDGDPDLNEVRAELGEKFANEIPLMDGGVYDNQGLDSINNIFSRIKSTDDLLIISDTDPNFTGFLKTPVAKDSGWLTISTLYTIIVMVFVLSFVSASAFIFNLIDRWYDPTFSWFDIIYLNAVPLVFCLAVFAGIFWARNTIKEALQGVEKTMGIPVWETVKKLNVKEVIELAGSRLMSLIAMANSVFMKRIRDLSYEKILSDRDLNPIAIVNQIYGLEDDPSQNAYDEREWVEFVEYKDLKPNAKLREVAQKAREYGTNLWFLEDDKENLDNLIKCGEASTCYELLVYLLTQKQPELRIAGSPARMLFDQALKEWIEFKK